MRKFNRQVLESWLDKGLVYGAGDGKRTACIEQAVALCLGLPLTDNPNGCIAPCLPAFCRRLNDSRWSSNKARSEGMRELAFEQLGTKGIDEKKFLAQLAERTIRELLPKVFRIVAEKQKEPHKKAMIDAAMNCELKGTSQSAMEARKAAYAANAYACAYAANAAASYAARKKSLRVSADTVRRLIPANLVAAALERK